MIQRLLNAASISITRNGLIYWVVSTGSEPLLGMIRVRVIWNSLFYLSFRPQWPSGKKTLSSAPHPKHMSVTSSSHGVTVPLYIGKAGVRGFFDLRDKIFVSGQLISRSCGVSVWVGQGFRGFFDLHEKIFFFSRNTRSCLATVDRVFFQSI
jgi:hypothetical protein